MKVSGLPTDPIRFAPRIEKKEDAGHSNSDERGSQEGQKEQNGDEDVSHSGSFDEQVLQAALASFDTDEQAKASGLKADTQGQGPGLRVVLKDGTGAIVRQFTGEEFVKLREACAKGNAARGKILDQKL